MKKKNPSPGVSGVLLLDKPSYITSTAAVNQVKKLFRANKAGHTGSLDPIATGLLPICLGSATKAAGFFLHADKTYWACIKLGETTDTGDSQGELIESNEVKASDRKIERVVHSFIGEYEQVPPMYSAVKVKGKPLYKYARKGLEVQRKARKVKIHNIQVLNIRKEFVSIELTCSRGFYVRVLAEEIGEQLGCGGHVQSLRRLGVGQLNVDDSYTIDAIRELDSLQDRLDLLVPCDETLTDLPKIDLSFDAAYYLCRGQTVRAKNLPATGIVRLYEDTVGFLGFGTSLGDGRVAPKRLFHPS